MLTATTTAAPAAAPATPSPAGLRFLWLEVTGRCNLTCRPCYSDSGPGGTQDDTSAGLVADTQQQGRQQDKVCSGSVHGREGIPGRPLLQAMLASAGSGMLLFGITPPRQNASPGQMREIAAVTLARLVPLNLDGLALYDIDDESDRNPGERPFPYLPTVDPATFHTGYLGDWTRPVILYRCVGKYPETDLRTWLGSVDPSQVLSVFVGASSGHKAVATSLRRAHALRQEICPDLMLGGVAIAERREEHLRLAAKQERGCAFFISQVIYNADATKSMISDYFYTCQHRRLAPRPVLFTLSVCGSPTTLAFLKWLGVDVPRWLENALCHAADTLAESYDQCLATARELTTFCRRLSMPFGFSVESVSIRKAEIEASAALAAELRRLLDSG